MTNFFNGSLSSPKGLRESNVLVVPANVKQPGSPLTIKTSFVAENFPNGTTVITLFISTDGGNTFQSASMTVEMPHVFRGPAPHFWTMTYELGPDDQPTHAKYSIDAPAAFQTPVTIDAVSDPVAAGIVRGGS